MISFTFPAMTMPFTVKLVPSNAQAWPAPRVQALRTALSADLTHVDHVFSPFRPDSLISRYRQQTLPAAELTSEFTTVFALASLAQAQTAGAFDPFYTGHYDPTGLVKGWAIQRVFTTRLRPLLDRGDLQAAAINGAGDLQLGVATGSAFHWQVGIEDPRTPGTILVHYALQNAAVATSGTRQHGEHIHRQVASTLQQATVLTPELTTADVTATAAIAMGPTRFLTYCRSRHLSAVLVGDAQAPTIIEGGVARV